MNSFTTQQVRNLTRGVRGALGFGIATSITANVIHSLSQHHDQTWQVWSSAGLAALAPLILFISTEMVTRIPVHSRVLGAIRLVITLQLAGFSGWISYWHMVDVSKMLGESGGSQYIYPLIIDGMMVVATISLIELGRLGQTVRAIEATAEVTTTVDDETKAKRSAAAKKAAVTRKANAAKATRKPRAPRAARTPVEEIEELESIAPVSPAMR